jgi:hypothetical protein
MINIDDALKSHFTYTQNITASYRLLKESYRTLSKTPSTNVVFESKRLGLFGIAEHYHIEPDGAVIYEYAVDTEIRKEGPNLPEPLDSILNCEHHYYSLKLNCLAYLSSRTIKSLVVRDSYNNESIPVRYNHSITELFISQVAPGELRSHSKRRTQFYLFQ